jgi:hypothetical protein
MKDRILYYVFFIVLGVGAGVTFGTMFKGCSSPEYTNSTQSDTIRISDTIVIRDTIRIREPKPYYVEVVRTDTLVFKDTLKVPIPIEQKTYKTEDYKAVIEGYKPNLLSIDLYKKETLIRDTVKINNTITKLKPPRWVISVGPGIGYGPKGVEPYIGINAGFVIWCK